MATNDDVIGGALLGFAVGAAAVAIGTTVGKRREFREQLASALGERQLGLVNSELGRDGTGVYWHLTVHHPRAGIQVVMVRLGNQDPYSPAALAFVLDRVSRWAWQAA